MNPATGTFITMDEYAGSVFEPVSLHKYLYANSNPVMNSDPTGYYSVASLVAGSAGMAEIAAAYATASVAAACAAIKLFNTILDISFNVIVQTTLINLQFTILTATDANYSVATMDMIVQNMFDSLRTIVDKKVDLT